MKRRLKAYLPVLILIILPLIFFHKSLMGDAVIVSGDLSGSDLLDLNFPFKHILNQNWPRGKIPLWEPDLSLGFPVLAEGQIGAFYPINILLSPLPAHLGLTYSIIAAFILAGIFTFLYARSLGLSRFSSLFAALTFTFSAFFVARLKHVNMITVAAWIPFLFWATRKFFQKKKMRFALLIGLGIALQFLAGHPEMTFFSIFLFLVYVLYEFSLSLKRESLKKTLPSALLGSFIIAVSALGLSLIQILPSLEFTALTEREEFTIQTATAYPFHPKNILTFIAPYYFGNPATASYTQDIRTTGIFWENASYIGLLPLILAIWAMLHAIRNKSRSTHLLFFTGLAFLSLLLMLGRFTPLYGLLWNLLPGFQLFRFPNRFNVFLILSLALLAGYGAQLLLLRLNALRTRPKIRTAEGVRLTWPLKPLPTQILIIGFILVDLFVFASSYIDTLPAEEFLKTPKIAERLASDTSHFRIYSLSQYGQSPYAVLGWKKDPEPLLAIREAIPPNTNLISNLPSFSDRSWFEGGLGLKRRHRLENYLLKENTDPIITGKILGTYNVKYIIAFSEALGIEIEKIQDYDLGEQFASPLNLFENKQVIPRAIFVPEAEVIQDEEAVFKRLISLDFLPTKTVILENQPQEIPAKFTGALDIFREENPLTITSYENQEVTIEADIASHGFLVLSDINYPGWKAQIDGNPAEILQANYLVRALELFPGKHTIRFYYDPLSFKIGAAVSAVTLIIILFFLSYHLVIKIVIRVKVKGR